MKTFKGYNKKQTSDKMMRIIKRERIMSCLVGRAKLEKVPKDEALKLIGDNHNYDAKTLEWKSKNIVRMTICEHISNKDYFNWKLKMFKETGWLRNQKVWRNGDYLYASWYDTRKLRIYYKWMHRAHKKTLKRILKYMYSPLFIAILAMDNGRINNDGLLEINLQLNDKESSLLLKQWFKDIFNIDIAFKANSLGEQDIDIIIFPDTDRVLGMIEPIVKEIPSMHKALFSAKHPAKTG